MIRMTSNDRHAIRSSNGKLFCDSVGFVTACESNADEDGQHLQDIEQFNLLEWIKHWGAHAADASLDILDLGYWYRGRDGVRRYSEPDADWRKTVAEDMFKRKVSQR